MNFIEKHSKILAVSLCLLTSGPIVSTMYAKEVQPGWHGEGADRYYILESNRQTVTGLTKIDTQLYYFNSKGEMQFGWQTVSDQTYYFKKDGTAATGTVTIQGSEYNFQKEGILLHGWSEDGKSFYDEKGKKTSTNWVEDNGVKYYFDENGNCVTGWQEIEGQEYYFGSDGKMATGQFDVDGTTYFTDSDGVFRTGWQVINGQDYYYAKNGEVTKNQILDIDGTKWAFDENGNLIKNAEKDGYKIDENGVATEITPEQTQTPTQNTTTSTPTQNTTTSTPAQSSTTNTNTTQAPVQNNTGSSTNNNYVPSTSNVNASAIASAALAQIGVTQDCTMLVTNSLKAVGINFHGWPEDYLSLGTITSNPVPGDIIVYSGHVAIYIGNGMAVHGGFYGSQTVKYSANCGNTILGYVHIG